MQPTAAQMNDASIIFPEDSVSSCAKDLLPLYLNCCAPLEFDVPRHSVRLVPTGRQNYAGNTTKEGQPRGEPMTRRSFTKPGLHPKDGTYLPMSQLSTVQGCYLIGQIFQSREYFRLGYRERLQLPSMRSL